MILGALIASSGVPLREMEELLSSSGSVMGETVVRLRRVEERGVEALEVDVRWEEGEGDIEALKMKAHLLDALQAAGLSRENRFAREAFERIVRAEEEVHNEPLAALHGRALGGRASHPHGGHSSQRTCGHMEEGGGGPGGAEAPGRRGGQ